MPDYPIDVDPIYGCWLWQADISKDGYPMVVSKGWRQSYAHRHVYEQEVGAIPKNHFLDHVCRRRSCVNPKHLQPVTQRENEKRKSWKYRVRNLKRCHVCRGKYDRNTPEGGFICRSCSQVIQ